jgi:hypothetical protein
MNILCIDMVHHEIRLAFMVPRDNPHPLAIRRSKHFISIHTELENKGKWNRKTEGRGEDSLDSHDY